MKFYMKISLLRLLMLAILAELVGFTSAGGSAEKLSLATASENRDWIYYRQLDIYFYLLTSADLPQQEKRDFRQKGYAFFFEYWILHRSKHAKLAPVARFEQDFARMLKKYATPFLEGDDPLGIAPYYKAGQFVGKPVPKIEGVVIPEAATLPQVEGLPGVNLKTWSGYQGYVSDFRTFFDAAAQPPKR